MPARVVFVHDDFDFTASTVAVLRHVVGDDDVALFTSSMAAVKALELAQKIEVLITRTEFPEGQPNGISLGLMARIRRPGVKILLLATVDTLEFTEGIGEVLVAPVTPGDVVTKVREMLGSLPPTTGSR